MVTSGGKMAPCGTAVDFWSARICNKARNGARQMGQLFA